LSKLLKDLLKIAGNEYATIAEQGIIAGDIHYYIDTGSYALNILLSGTPYGGIAGNKIVGFAGEESTGKTFYAIETCKSFLNQFSDGLVLYFCTESDFSKKTLEDRGVDTSRVAVLPVATVEEFRTQLTKQLNMLLESSERPKIFVVLDSIGNLSTNKESTDMASGADKRDMTKQQLLRGTFRVITLKLGKLQIPMLCVNHTYEVVGAYIPTKEMSGGGGLKYAASQIIYLSKKKAKEKEGGEDQHIGAIITAKLDKSRLTREGMKVETRLRFDTGLDRYFGLIDIAEELGIIRNIAKKYVFPDGTAAFESAIEKNPAKYFTKEVLDLIAEKAPARYLYGSGEAPAEEETDIAEGVETE
jgi:RecA/RadA recombinase